MGEEIGLAQDRKPAISLPKHDGIVKGTLVGHREVKGEYRGKETKNTLWKFKEGEEEFEVWGFGLLDYKLKQAKEGMKLSLEYTGKSEEGYHQVTVEKV